MIGERTDFTLTATVQAPLHIGTGDEGEVNGLGKDGASVKVALVQVDYDGYPIIPGSGIKGVLAHLFDEKLVLFGGKDSAADGDMLSSGKVIFWSGVMDRASCQTFGPNNDKIIAGTNHPHADRSLFIETNTAIDGENGVAQAGRLYHRQMVAPGTRFTLAFAADADLDERQMARLFAVLCDSAGVSLGKGTKSSLGRIIVDLATLDAQRLGPDGTKANTSAHWRKLIAATAPLARRSFGRLKLSCDGPYLIADPAAPRERGDNSTPHIAPRRTHLDQPFLAGTTLLGALRAGFAAWLSKTGHDGADNRDRVCKAIGDAENLSQTERIFGVTGWKGLLSVSNIASTGTNHRQTITSVKLDRFSNAPIDNALFSTEAWVAPAFEVALNFDEPRSDGDQSRCFLEFLTALNDPIWGGLQLGHGTNKGFGWFTAKFERSET